MLKIYGRANSVNVRKLLWLLDELDMPYERVDAGMEHGVVNTPHYRALNPTGRIPTLLDGEVVLWESNTCLRYLAMIGGAAGERLYPTAPAARASIDRWLDWQLSTLGPAERMMFWGIIRTAPEKRDNAAIATAVRDAGECWRVIDARLADGRRFIEGEALTLADIVLGAYASRWFNVPAEGKVDVPNLSAWFDRVNERPGFARWIAGPQT